MNPKVIRAVFKRNFAGYFSSPIGYVFICAFVLMTGFAAFWPNEFFNANLATLDQLNRHLPWIMLVFIPAITMSIWAEERRQGTDELLLTLPGSDLDVVIGKYLAALAIFTVALAFSLSNLIVLVGLGAPDLGLLFANYAGYWLVGAAMLAIGMVASFLTNSLTVAFVLACALNAPLIFAASADAIVPWEDAARFIKSMSIDAQFEDFGRGLITFSGIVFFLAIIAVSLYLSMVLIGRRHWAGGEYATVLTGHYFVRALSLVAVVIGVCILFHRFDLRVDASQENVNSLSPQSIDMLRNINPERPVYVEAYISPNVPEEYVQTRLNLLSMLREVDARTGDKVVVRVHDTDRFSDEEAHAEQLYSIRPQAVQSTAGGKMAVDQIILGAAFSCGLDKVVVPFFNRGVPVEYEVVRSIATVSQQQRKRIGVLTTDAKLFGGFDMNTFAQRPDEPIIEELKKQYDVVQVNPDAPIGERYDALLAVQPSSLTQPQMDNFLMAVRSGQPTAIFEDPFPYFDQSVPGTTQPRMPPSRNPFMQQPQPEPKGDVSPLWPMLGVRFRDREVIWQEYNPYPKLTDLPPEFVFIGTGSGAAEPFSPANDITSGLQQMLALFPGSIDPAAGNVSGLTFTPLLQTGQQTGVVAQGEIMQRDFLGRANFNQNRRLRRTEQPYTLAAHITGPAPSAAATQPENTPNLNVVLVSDIDVLYGIFFHIRSRGRDENDPVDIDLDNVAFVLNTLDFLAGDERFIDIRKRRPAYKTLTAVEQKAEQANASAGQEREKFIAQFEAKRAEEQQRLDDKLKELEQRQGMDPQQLLIEVSTAREAGQTRLQKAVEQMEKERDEELEKIERRVARQIRSVQNNYKLAAIALPPILPLALAMVVYQRRRSMEKLGVPKSRLK